MSTADPFSVAYSEADRPTAAQFIEEPATPRATAALIPQVSTLRYRVDTTRDEVVSLDRTVFQLDLRERAAAWERQSTFSLLETLQRRWGLAWSMIAKMLGVTVPALRRWRRGEASSPAHRAALAQLGALMEMLEEHFMIEDPASWLEIPLASTVTTLADVYAIGRLDLVLEYAGRRITTPEAVLAQLDPDWRVTMRREFEVFVAPDGGTAIRRRGTS